MVQNTYTIINVIHHINNINYIDAENDSDKIQWSVMIKNSQQVQQVGYRSNILQNKG